MNSYNKNIKGNYFQIFLGIKQMTVKSCSPWQKGNIECRFCIFSGFLPAVMRLTMVRESGEQAYQEAVLWVRKVETGILFLMLLEFMEYKGKSWLEGKTVLMQDEFS